MACKLIAHADDVINRSFSIVKETVTETKKGTIESLLFIMRKMGSGKYSLITTLTPSRLIITVNITYNRHNRQTTNPTETSPSSNELKDLGAKPPSTPQP